MYTKDSIPATVDQIPTGDDIQRWPHLHDITLPELNSTVDLLIGNNVPDAYSPLEVITGPTGSPHATRSRLGWVVWNLIRPHGQYIIDVNTAQVDMIQQLEDDQSLDKKMMNLFNTDFPEKLTDDRREPSCEDRKFISKVEKSLQLIDGHYSMCLPFKYDDVYMPNNERLVYNRQSNLKKKLSKDESLHQQYADFMEDLVKHNYAERVPEEELAGEPHKVWYIPQHAVLNPKKNKIRVVFDGASTFSGVSLNQMLLQGPDLTCSLLGVLIAFRLHDIAIKADIEKMFYQVKVDRADVEFLRYFWWPEGNLNAKAVPYRMLVPLFGAASSPSCANVALHRTAEDNRSTFRSEICDTILTNFHVDDLLKSMPTEEKSVSLVEDVPRLCSLGGFRLTQWSSNSRQVLKHIPEDDRAKSLKSLDLDSSRLPGERALGVCWCPETDQFKFDISPRELSVPTRRSILSLTSSIFDPLGFLSPYTLKAKVLQQDLCKLGIPWDEPIQDSFLDRWQKWQNELTMLNQFLIPRCLHSYDLSEVIIVDLHHFADASDIGYGVVSYARFVYADGHISCCLLMSRARVNPGKKVTVPRLELTASTVAVRLNKMIQEPLGDYFMIWKYLLVLVAMLYWQMFLHSPS